MFVAIRLVLDKRRISDFIFKFLKKMCFSANIWGLELPSIIKFDICGDKTVTRCHRKIGYFSALERRDFSKNSIIFNLQKWDYFKPTLKHSEIESFNSRFRDELLNRELFLSNDELRYVADR